MPHYGFGCHPHPSNSPKLMLQDDVPVWPSRKEIPKMPAFLSSFFLWSSSRSKNCDSSLSRRESPTPKGCYCASVSDSQSCMRARAHAIFLWVRWVQPFNRHHIPWPGPFVRISRGNQFFSFWRNISIPSSYIVYDNFYMHRNN